jgi:ketosteroid isomerase-like protein
MPGRLRISSAALACCLFCTSAGQAQQASAEEAAVRKLDEQERVAVLKADRGALERLWSEQLTVNAPTNRVNVGRQGVLDLIARGVLHYSSFERAVEAVRLYGDVAVIMGAETARSAGKAPGAGELVHRRFTNVWKKERGTWVMIARQAATIPQGSPAH